jgi:hypothetical protein
MSIVLSAILVLFITILVSQFGGKLNAKSSLIWWLIFLFLLLCTVYPEILLPVAHILGIQLVSNLVLASLIVFLMFLAIQESALTTFLTRRMRDLVSTQASREYSVTPFKQHSEGHHPKRVLIVFPTFNEEKSLPSMADRLRTVQGDSKFEFHFCFVNDGSEDGSETILSEHFEGRYVSHTTNIGVAGAMLTGFKILKRAKFDYVVQCDADGQHPVDQILRLVSEADRLNADLLIGSRYLSLNSFQAHESSTLTRRVGSTLIRLALRLFSFRYQITDPTSGFRVYSRNAALFLMKNMPDEYPEPESAALLMHAKKKIVEVQVEMTSRTTGVSSLAGIRSAQFMIKVLSALIGLRMRSW